MSAISCVASRVFTRLSPSPPSGRVSMSKVMFGFFLVNAAASASAGFVPPSLLPTR